MFQLFSNLIIFLQLHGVCFVRFRLVCYTCSFRYWFGTWWWNNLAGIKSYTEVGIIVHNTQIQICWKWLLANFSLLVKVGSAGWWSLWPYASIRNIFLLFMHDICCCCLLLLLHSIIYNIEILLQPQMLWMPKTSI